MLLTSFFSFFLLAYSLALSSHRNDFMTFIRCFHHKTRIIGLLCFLPMCSLTPETAPVCFFPSLWNWSHQNMWCSSLLPEFLMGLLSPHFPQ
jgi:hypothetical protein